MDSDLKKRTWSDGSTSVRADATATAGTMVARAIAPALELVVARTEQLAHRALLLELALPNGADLPAYHPGAHICLHLDGGLRREYSLLYPYEDSRARYAVCVKLSETSRGGSRFIHSRLQRGVRAGITGPYNHFPLAEDAVHSVFIAGGIGITPIWCMLARLRQLGRSWELHYAAHAWSGAVCINEATALAPQARCYVADCQQDRMDIAPIVASAPDGSHMYCCGPQGMLSEFRTVTRDLPRERVHFESFHPADTADGGDFLTVELASDGRVVEVPANKTILECLRAAGVDVPSSCRQGVCGACETRVLSGVPDHRDMVLSEAERKSNRTMMVCCSRAKDRHLMLDL